MNALTLSPLNENSPQKTVLHALLGAGRRSRAAFPGGVPGRRSRAALLTVPDAAVRPAG